MAAWGPNGIFLQERGMCSGFVQPERLPLTRAFHEVDTVAPRIPDRLANLVRPWYESLSVSPTVDLTALFPKPERERAFPKVECFDPDPVYLRPGYLEFLAGKKRLRYSDDE